jgi:hypothetical protein
MMCELIVFFRTFTMPYTKCLGLDSVMCELIVFFFEDFYNDLYYYERRII